MLCVTTNNILASENSNLSDHVIAHTPTPSNGTGNHGVAFVQMENCEFSNHIAQYSEIINSPGLIERLEEAKRLCSQRFPGRVVKTHTRIHQPCASSGLQVTSFVVEFQLSTQVELSEIIEATEDACDWIATLEPPYMRSCIVVNFTTRDV